jgi:hypothetical protein
MAASCLSGWTPSGPHLCFICIPQSPAEYKPFPEEGLRTLGCLLMQGQGFISFLGPAVLRG